MPVYTWDFKNFVNTFADNLGERSFTASKAPPELPGWATSLMVQEIRPLTPEEAREVEKYGATSRGHVRISYKLLPEGEAWVQEVYAKLDKDFPHTPESPHGFYLYACPLRGGLVIYDPGFDMYREWPKIFGVTNPMFTECRKLGDAYRPWLSEGSPPNVFYDGNKPDYHMTDSMGAPYFLETDLQNNINWLYAFRLGEDSQWMSQRVLNSLGIAAVAWKCPVQPA